MKQTNEAKPRRKATPKLKWWQKPIYFVPIIIAIISAFSITINWSLNLSPEISPTPQPISNVIPSATLSIEEQLAILGATATKSAEMTASQEAINLRNTAEADLTLQQFKTEIAATETQNAIATVTAVEASRLITQTAFANMTATIQASDEWLTGHKFVDDFTSNMHQWNGEDSVTRVQIDQPNGILHFETNTTRELAFWTCDFCSVPTDHSNYVFEVKYFAPTKTDSFNFGLLFGCEQFNEDLVSCQAIQIIEQSIIRVSRTGTSKEYERVDLDKVISPNAKGLISISWEVINQEFKLSINNQNIINGVKLDGGGGGIFGFYANPSGSTVIFDYIEIAPHP